MMNIFNNSIQFQVKLIVIDSFSYLLRSIDDPTMNLVQVSYELLSKLQTVAEEFKCAVRHQ